MFSPLTFSPSDNSNHTVDLSDNWTLELFDPHLFDPCIFKCMNFSSTPWDRWTKKKKIVTCDI